MDLDVPHDAHGPVFYQKDVVFTKIIVDEVFKKTSYGSIDQRFKIYYAGTEDGRVFKVARWKSSERFQSRLLDIISVTEPEPIRAMALSKKSKMLIVTTDYGIKQVPTEDNCKKQYQVYIVYLITILSFFLLYTTVGNLDDDGLCSLALAIRCAAYFLVHDLDEIFHYYHVES